MKFRSDEDFVSTWGRARGEATVGSCQTDPITQDGFAAGEGGSVPLDLPPPGAPRPCRDGAIPSHPAPTLARLPRFPHRPASLLELCTAMSHRVSSFVSVAAVVGRGLAPPPTDKDRAEHQLPPPDEDNPCRSRCTDPAASTRGITI